MTGSYLRNEDFMSETRTVSLPEIVVETMYLRYMAKGLPCRMNDDGEGTKLLQVAPQFGLIPDLDEFLPHAI